MKSRKASHALDSVLTAFVLGSLTSNAVGQDASPQGSQPSEAREQPLVETVTVTGSRLSASGFTMPTPVTMTTAEKLIDMAPANLADGLNQLPVFKGSVSSNRASNGSPNGYLGQNLLDLRGLGTVRTLVLLDGRRMVSSSAVVGGVDINLIPQDVVERVDVVTGGASAAYGSDAVAGVVNFVLDTHFRGIKGAIQAGSSAHGDADSLKANLSFGAGFADDRGSILLSGEYFDQDGIAAYDSGGREWFENAAGRMSNTPSTAQPRQLIMNDVRSSISSYGGLITSGPLRGTAFQPGGIPYAFDAGDYVAGAFQSGGDGASAIGSSLAPAQERTTAFVHTEYALTDDLTLYAEGNYAKAHTVLDAYYNFSLGGNFQLTIFQDNAFLPQSIRDQMSASNIPSFVMGRTHADMPTQLVDSTNELKRVVVGLDGRFSDNWSYGASFVHGESNQVQASTRFSILRNLYASVDSVIDPATGQAVCRSTLSGFDPGCVPMNPFGQGSVTPDVVDYVQGESIRDLTLTQQVFSFDVDGTLPALSLPAGPIAVAAGLEFRQEKAEQTADSISAGVADFTGIRGVPAALQGRQGGFPFFNPVPLEGDYDIKEGYVELGVPLLRNLPGARALDFNGAVRTSDYSASGRVESWKLGLTYRPIEQLLVRATQSRDIRGPNINELFNPQSLNSSFVLVNNVSTPYTGFRSGNPTVAPEKADTTTFGVVYQPSQIDGLSLSVDYFNIDIKDAIGSLSAQQTVDLCADGSQVACAQITQVGEALQIRFPSLNLLFSKTSGVDIEVAYAGELGDGSIDLRALGTYTHEYSTQAPGAPKEDRAGENGSASQPEWIGLFQATYTLGNFGVTLQERYISAGKLDATWIEGVDIDDNSVPAVFYTDLSASLDTEMLGMKGKFVLTVNNLFDKDPPTTPGPASTFQFPANVGLYQTMGTYITGTVRFEF